MIFGFSVKRAKSPTAATENVNFSSSERESHVDVPMEALRLANHKLFGAASEKSGEAFVEPIELTVQRGRAGCGSREGRSYRGVSL